MASNVFPDKFKALVIPVEFLKLNGPSFLDKGIMARVWAFQRDGCWMSNASFAILFTYPRRTIERRISDLIAEGWLLSRGRDRIHRLLFVNMEKVREQLPTK